MTSRMWCLNNNNLNEKKIKRQHVIHRSVFNLPWYADWEPPSKQCWPKEDCERIQASEESKQQRSSRSMATWERINIWANAEWVIVHWWPSTTSNRWNIRSMLGKTRKQRELTPHLWLSLQQKCRLIKPWRDLLPFGTSLCCRTYKWTPKDRQAIRFHGTTTPGTCSVFWNFVFGQSSKDMKRTSLSAPHRALKCFWESLEQSFFHPLAWCQNWSKNKCKNIHDRLKIRFFKFCDSRIHEYQEKKNQKRIISRTFDGNI